MFGKLFILKLVSHKHFFPCLIFSSRAHPNQSVPALPTKIICLIRRYDTRHNDAQDNDITVKNFSVRSEYYALCRNYDE
jgi:hypothetical protein